MTIDEMKQRFEANDLNPGIYSAGDNKFIIVDSNGFTINTIQDNGWVRANIYEFIDGEWVESETYEKGE